MDFIAFFGTDLHGIVDSNVVVPLQYKCAALARSCDTTLVGACTLKVFSQLRGSTAASSNFVGPNVCH
eukprot:538377-Rhodomonas_salina.1